MEKIFYADITAYSSEAAIIKILSEFYGIRNAVILRTENGKPYLENAEHGPFFSVSHTTEKLFIAFSSANVGIDAEPLSRKTSYASVVKKFPLEEREEIACAQDFLKHWVVRESAVKYLGGTLARDLKRLSYIDGRLSYGAVELPVKIKIFTFEEHILSVCGEKDFENAEFIRLSSPSL